MTIDFAKLRAPSDDGWAHLRSGELIEILDELEKAWASNGRYHLENAELIARAANGEAAAHDWKDLYNKERTDRLQAVGENHRLRCALEREKHEVDELSRRLGILREETKP